MFQVSLTSFGQTLVSELVNIDGIILLYDTVDVATLTSISSYTVQLDEEACGNLKNSVGNIFIRDLSNSQYQAKTILFYKNINNEKKIVAGYSQETPLVQKTSSILSIYLTLDFSAFTNGFLFASIQAGYSTAAHNTDGLLHLENPSIDSDDDYAVYSKSQTDDLLQYKQDTLTAGNGIAITDDVVKTTGIPFGIVDGTSTSTVFTVTVPGIYKLEDGVCCLVKNGVITSASGFTLNVNGLGGKPVYSNMAAATRETTIFNVNYTMLFVYDSTRIDGGCWICYRGYYSDANSIAYQIRGNVHTLPTTAKFYRYRLLFTSADGTHFVPSNTSTSTNATAIRDVNQTPIDPFGEIVYYSTTAAVEANTDPGPTYLWTQYAITFGYSFNRTGAALVLDSFKPLYIKCTPQSDGSAIIDATTPYVQSLPSTADGKIYIFLGITSSATSVELLNNHPVYYHDGTAIRIWHGKDSYTKDEIDSIVSGYVPTSRTVNNKPLSSDVTLTLDDIADGTNRTIPIVNDSTITIKKSASDTGDSFTTNATSGKTINLGLSTVATSGSYSDLSNTPTIPTVNDAKLTIKKNSSDTGVEFTANASSDVTCNLNLADVASSGSYNDLSNTPTIPTDTSDLTNGAGFLTIETDPTVPSWAKQSSKPSYNLDEVTDGTTRKLSDYVPTSRKVNNKTLTSDITLTLDDVADGTNRSIPTVNNATLTIQKNGTTVNTFTANASSNVTANITVPTTVAELTDANNYAQTSSLSSLVATAQYNSTDKTIEFYNAAGTKLNTDVDATAFIKDGMVDDVEITGGNLVISFNTDAGKEDIEIPISDIFDANNYYTKTQVDNLIPTVNNATLTIQKNGTTVNTFTANASSNVTANITVPTTVAELSDSSNYVTTNDLATVATSGDYDDLINKPTIPTVNNATLTIKKTASDTGTTFTANASTDVTCNLDLATVATSGSYSDLLNTPTIPTVNNATLTIQQNGTTVDTFTANSASDVTVNITVPTNTNQLTNGAGFITSTALATYVEKVDPSTENAIVRFRNVKGDLKDSGVLIDDHNNVILPTGRDTANADKNPHIDIGQSWLGNISSRDTVLYVGTLTSNTYTTRYAFQQTAFKPMTDDSYSLGFTSFRWKYLYLSNSIKNGSYTYSLPSSTGTLALTSDIPTNVSAFTNDSGYLTSYTETDPTVPSWAKEQNKPSYTLDEVSDGTTRKLSDYVPTSRTVNSKALTTDIILTLDDISDGTNRSIPTDTSDLTNGAGYITGYTETDPTVPAWAKASTKPSYTASEVGALPDTTVIPTATTARSDNNYLYNGQNVDTLIDNVGISSSNNLLNTSGVTSYIALRANNNNPFLGLKCGSNVWYAQASTNYFYFGPTSSNALRLDQSGNGVFQTGTCTATGFVYKNGNTTGTSTQFLKADGSIDSNTYLTSASLAGYVPTSRTINSQALTSDIILTLDDISDGTNRVIPTTTSQLTNNSGFITSSDLPTNHVTTDTVQTITALKTFTNGIDLGTYHTSASQSLSTQLTVWDDTTNYQGGIEVTGNFNPATEDEYNLGSSNFPWLNVYANSFIKSGGTSAQFLKADGSVDNNTYLTSSDLPTNHVTTDTIQEITGAKTIAENKLKIGSTSSNEDIDNFVFKRGQEFIIGTQTSATSLWKGNTIQDSIYEGMCVNYFVPVACTSTAVTLELTLPDGTTTGAIPVRRNAANTVTNTHIGVGSVVQLTLLLNRTVGSTSYEKVWRMNEWYDSNTNTTGYQLRTNSTVMTVTDTARYYKLYFTSADGEHWVPASVNSTNNATTARAVNQRPINPFGRIVYTSASTSYTAGSNLAATTIWDQYAIALGYSFNVNGGDLTLTTKTPVYVKCAPQTDGSAIIDSTNPIVQDLPTSADGKIYVFLGIAYDATHIELVINHPVYYHDGNGIKLWTGSTIPSKTSDLTNDSGYITTETDPTVPSWAKQSSKPSYTLDEVTDGTTRKLSDYVRLATTNRENQTINSSITIHPKHNSYNNYREYTFNGTDFSAQTSMELVSWDFESNETVTRSIKLSLQPAIYSEENLEPAYYFRLYTVNSTNSNYEEIFFITKEFDSNSSYYNVNGTAVANYSSVPNTSLVDGRLTTVDYVNAKVKEVYCNATTEVDRDLVPSNYDYRENAPQGTHSDNPKYKGNDVSLGVNQYLEFSDNMRVSVYVLNETYVGSIAFLTADNASTYAAYPVYFRGQGSAHNASVPAGSVLRLTFKQNSFNVDFYDLADFGVEHEPIVRVGQVPHHKTLNSYNGALVGIRKDNRKFDHAITVIKSASNSSNTLLNMEPNSPIYVSFMGECFAAHPRVPFGFVTNMEYIYSAGASLTLNNIPFVYVEGGLQVTDLDELQSHIVENTVGGQRYFHVDDAPVYILLSDEYDPLYISIGGLPIDSDGHLIGYLCHGAEHAGLIRLVQNNLPTRASLSARMLTTYSGTSKLVAESSYISARDDIYPNINSTSSSNGYTLGSSSYKWRYIYLSSGISNGTYTYSLPSATGTLALTSDLPTNYVTTDTAQTISGNKTFTGTLTGTLTGNADSASKLKLLGNNSNESYPIVFAESVNTSTSSAISKTLYTDSAYNYSLTYNPNTNTCYCTTFNGSFELPSTSTIRFFSNATNFYTKITQGQLSSPNRSVISISGFDSSDTIRSSLSIHNGADSDGTSSVLPSLGNWSIGSASDRWKNLYIDNIYIGSNNTSLSNYIADTTVVNATNASNVGILGNSTSSNYPLVFTGSVNTSTSSAVNKKLYTDTANSLYYNPSINALSGLFILPKGDATLSGSTWTVSSPSPNTTTSEDPPNGAIVAVYFPSSNTATSPQLKFGSWNAKPIWRTTSTYVGTSPDLSWNDATYVLFIYSSGWRILNFNNNPTSTASGTASIIPSSTNTYNLGSSSYKWNYLYARYVGSSSYPITSIYGRLNSLYGTAVGSLFFFKLIIKNNSSNDITVPRGVSLANTTYFGSTLLQITSYEERVDDTSSSYGTATFTGTFYTMLRFTVTANSSGSTVFVPCLRYS